MQRRTQHDGGAEVIKHIQLYVVREEDGGSEWLSDDPTGYPFSRPATEEDITPDTLAAMLDNDAEQANHHDFAGAHAGLVRLISGEAGYPAKEILRYLADIGGLQCLADWNYEQRANQ
jgi:hypothetical protein